MAKKQTSYSEHSDQKKLSKKERKALKKQQEAEQRELEKALIEQGKLSPRVKYERRSFLWNAVAVSLAFVLGIGATIGGIAGGLYIAASKTPIKNLLGTFGVDYSEYVEEDYASKSVLEVGTELASTDFVNLQSIGKFTPYLRKQLEKIKELLSEFGITLDVDEFMQTAFGELSSYFHTVINSAELGGVLGLSADSDKLMLSICYGKEGEDEDYTVDESGNVVMNEGKTATTIQQMTEDSATVINRVEVATMMDVGADSSPAMRYLAYGREGIDYEITEDAETQTKTVHMLGESKPKKLGELSKDDSTLLDDARICDLVEITEESSNLMRAIKNWTVSQLKHQSRIERLKIKQVLTIDKETSSRLIQAIEDWRIGDLSKQEKINTLTINDVLTITEESPLLLRSLQSATIGKFDEAIKTLRLEEMIPEIDANKLLRHLKNSTVDTLSSDVKALTVQQVFDNEIYGYCETYDAYGKPIDILTPDDSEGENPTEPKISVQTVHKDTDGNELSKGYFTAETGGVLVEGETVLYDALIAMHNREIQTAEQEGLPTEYVWETPYYYVERVRVTSDYTLFIVDHENGGELKPLDTPIQTETVNGEEKQYFDMTVTKETQTEDEPETTQEVYRMYLGIDEAGNDYAEDLSMKQRVDLERVYTYYLEGHPIPDRPENEETPADGAVYRDDIRHYKEQTETGEIIEEYDYFERRVSVYESFYYLSGGTAAEVNESDVKEEYYKVTTTDGGATVEIGSTPLTRYIRGMWHFLLTVKEEDPIEGTIVREQEFSLLDMDDIVSNVAKNVDGASLLNLWMHDVLSGATPPDADISSLHFHINGTTHSGSGTCSDCITNINELTINQTVVVVKLLLEKLGGS